MALKKLRMICAGGDKTLAEWDTETVIRSSVLPKSKENSTRRWPKAGSRPTFPKNAMCLIREFDPNAEILLIPRVQGGL